MYQSNQPYSLYKPFQISRLANINKRYLFNVYLIKSVTGLPLIKSLII